MFQLKHSCVLFRQEDGKPVRFYMYPCPARVSLKYLIEHGGGEISSKLFPDSIKLAEKGQKIKSDGYIKAQYVKDCVKMNKLIDMDRYKVKPGSNSDSDMEPAKVIIRADSRSRKGRKQFLLSEDNQILRFILDQKRTDEIGGNLLWKNMEMLQITPHSWQAMKDRFRKVLLPNIRKYRLKAAEIAAFKGKPMRLRSKKKTEVETLSGDSSSEELDGFDNELVNQAQKKKPIYHQKPIIIEDHSEDETEDSSDSSTSKSTRQTGKQKKVLKILKVYPTNNVPKLSSECTKDSKTADKTQSKTVAMKLTNSNQLEFQLPTVKLTRGEVENAKRMLHFSPATAKKEAEEAHAAKENGTKPCPNENNETRIDVNTSPKSPTNDSHKKNSPIVFCSPSTTVTVKRRLSDKIEKKSVPENETIDSSNASSETSRKRRLSKSGESGDAVEVIAQESQESEGVSDDLFPMHQNSVMASKKQKKTGSNYLNDFLLADTQSQTYSTESESFTAVEELSQEPSEEQYLVMKNTILKLMKVFSMEAEHLLAVIYSFSGSITDTVHYLLSGHSKSGGHRWSDEEDDILQGGSEEDLANLTAEYGSAAIRSRQSYLAENLD